MVGMFFLIRNFPGTDRRQAAACRLAQRMGFGTPKIICANDMTLYLYPKLGEPSAEIITFPNGDYVAACGTFLFSRSRGEDALRKVYAAFNGDWSILDAAFFNFAIIIRKDGCTHVAGDRFGGYHIFRDAMLNVVSSSFLIAAELVEGLTLLSQSVFEYVFNGVVSGNDTLVKELTLVPVGGALIFNQGVARLDQSILKPISEPSVLGKEELLQQCLSILNERFGLLAELFGSRLTCALSGGFDSRLILALARRAGVQPRVYVYGKQTDKDVVIASQIACAEKFDLEIIDKEAQPLVDDFREVIATNYLASDGYIGAGIFNNGAEHRESASRVAGRSIALNGGGGEIFRNFFYLLDGKYTIKQIAWSFYAQFDPVVCTRKFKSGNYFRHIERKMMELVGRDGLLERPTVEWLYHKFRCRSWDGRVDTINSRYGYTGLPFLSAPLTEIGASIPIRWKHHGAFQAELIARTDRRLASYPSSYGYRFASGAPTLTRVANFGTYIRPPWARRLTYRWKHRWSAGQSSPYIDSLYINEALPEGVETLRSFFHLERVGDPNQMARILTLEYLIRQVGSRIQVGA